MITHRQIKQKLGVIEWNSNCQRLLEFVKRIKHEYNDTDITIDDIDIITTHDPCYLERNSDFQTDVKMIKEGKDKFGSYWIYAVYNSKTKTEGE